MNITMMSEPRIAREVVLYYNHKKNITNYTIPDNVTALGLYAFEGCAFLDTISIPNNVKSVGTMAFGNCSRLKSVEFSQNLDEIDYMAFTKCIRLERIELPPKLSRVGSCAFQYCHKLACVKIPNSVYSVGECAFSECGSLTYVELPSFDILGQNAFRFTNEHITFIVDFLTRMSHEECEIIRTYDELEIILKFIGISKKQTVYINHSFQGSSERIITIPNLNTLK